VPHVTIAEEATGARIEAALGAMTGYRSLVTIERVHLLQEGPGRVWAPIADVPFGPPAVVGRGGLPLELTVSIQPDPAARAVAGAVTPFAVTARRDGRVVGAAEGAVAGPVAHLHRLEVPSADRGQGVGLHLLRSVESLAAERGCEVLVAAPHEFLRRHGWVDGRRAVGRATATPATATPATAHGSSPP
jgi:GNAT superfamily N-acetyltransferase